MQCNERGRSFEWYSYSATDAEGAHTKRSTWQTQRKAERGTWRAGPHAPVRTGEWGRSEGQTNALRGGRDVDHERGGGNRTRVQCAGSSSSNIGADRCNGLPIARSGGHVQHSGRRL